MASQIRYDDAFLSSPRDQELLTCLGSDLRDHNQRHQSNLLLLLHAWLLQRQRHGRRYQPCKSYHRAMMRSYLAHRARQNASFTLTYQKSLALQAAFALSPGETAPAETDSSSSSPSIYAIATTTSTSMSTESSPPSSKSPATTNTSPSEHNKALSVAEIVGIVIGSLAGVALVAALCFFVGRSHTYSKLYKTDDKRNSGQSRLTDSAPDMAVMENGGNNDWKHGAVSYTPLSPSPTLQSPSPGFPPTYARERQELGDHEQSRYIGSLETQAHTLPSARRPMSSLGLQELESETPLEME